LEANERTAQNLEAVDRARVEAQRIAAKTAKVKKERSCESLRFVKGEADEGVVSPVPLRPQKTIHPPITYGSSQFKKKKTKRVIDSDDENQGMSLKPIPSYFMLSFSTPTANRDRSTTLASPPPQSHQTSTSGLKLKLLPTHPSKASPSPSNHSSSNIDFTLQTPPNRPLVPPRPGVQAPPIPGPKRQGEVDIDFSNVKAPQQVPSSQFMSSVEPYLRDLREDDLAMLGFKVSYVPSIYFVRRRQSRDLMSTTISTILIHRITTKTLCAKELLGLRSSSTSNPLASQEGLHIYHHQQAAESIKRFQG